MFEVHADLAKNRIYITLGKVAKEEVKEVTTAIRQNLQHLSIGFTCVTDISHFEPLSDAENHRVAEIQKTMKQLGMSRVVRVVGDSQLGHFLLNQISKSEPGYTADVVRSLAEAEALLDHQADC